MADGQSRGRFVNRWEGSFQGMLPQSAGGRDCQWRCLMVEKFGQFGLMPDVGGQATVSVLGPEIGTGQGTLPVVADHFGRTPHIALSGAFLALRAPDCNGWPRPAGRREWRPRKNLPDSGVSSEPGVSCYGAAPRARKARGDLTGCLLYDPSAGTVWTVSQ